MGSVCRDLDGWLKLNHLKIAKAVFFSGHEIVEVVFSRL